MWSGAFEFDDAVLGQRMAALDALLDDMTPVLERIADDAQNRVFTEQFDTEGGRAHGWAPLSPEYAAWKARFFPGPILQRTGRMRDDFTGRGSDTVRRLEGGDTLHVGASTPYAGAHQKGTDRLVARPPADATDEDRERWAEMVAQAIRDEWGGQ